MVVVEEARYSAIDLFSGCGGLTAGLKAAGFRVLAAIEIDRLAADTYALNHPEVRIWRTDIRALSTEEVMDELGLQEGDLDLLAGCPPCQGFSRLRTLNGSRTIPDPRNRLIRDFLRFVVGMLPKAVMFENVPGLLRRTEFHRFHRDLEQLGYAADYREVDAAAYGVPQRRERVILLAARAARIPYPDPLTVRRTVRDAIGCLPRPGDSGDEVHDLPENRTSRTRRLIGSIPKDGGSMSDLGREARLPCHKRCRGFSDVYGRMAWDAVAPTITTGCVNPSKGRFLHPQEDRCVTLREAALLQSFSRGYRFQLCRGKFPAAALIGNAFPPELAKWHAAAVARFLKESSAFRDA
ncbi:MAG: DNA cytosine methyltransferase [Acidobacteriota bacterium]